MAFFGCFWLLGWDRKARSEESSKIQEVKRTYMSPQMKGRGAEGEHPKREQESKLREPGSGQ